MYHGQAHDRDRANERAERIRAELRALLADGRTATAADLYPHFVGSVDRVSRPEVVFQLERLEEDGDAVRVKGVKGGYRRA